MSEPEWHDGGCFCGAVRYRVRGESVWKAGCRCNTCVKMHGAPCVVWAGFDQTDYQRVRGELVAFRSSANVIREFCTVCGTTLTYRKDARGDPALEQAVRIVYIAVATLDDPKAYPPDEIVHGQERIAWLHLGGDIPLRGFTSPDAGHLQFGGIARAAKPAADAAEE